MKPVDDRILEYLDDNQAGTPKSIAEATSKHNDYIGTRCRKLAERGLVDRVSRGLYSITDEGRAYLAGDLDASELED